MADNSGPQPPKDPATFASAASTFRGGGQLVAALFRYAPHRMTLMILLLLTASVTEAFGLVMLIPLLHVAGLDGDSGGHPVTAAIEDAVSSVGLELNLSTALLAFLVLIAIRAAVAWKRTVLAAEVRQGFVDGYREELFTAMVSARWDYLLAQRLSDVQHAVTSSVNRIGNGAFTVVQLGVSAVFASTQIALALALSPVISAIALCAGALLMGIHHPLTRRARTLGELLTKANRGIFSLTSDLSSALKLAKGHGAERRHVKRLVETIQTARQSQLAFLRASATVTAATSLITAALLVGIVWMAISHSMASTAELAVTALIFMRVLPQLSGLQAQGRGLANALPAFEYAQTMREGFLRAAEPVLPAGQALPAAHPGLKTGLQLRHVSFAYDSGGPVLRDINVDVPAGMFTVVAGPSGAGKTTLADILLGLLAPSIHQQDVGGAGAEALELNGGPSSGVFIDGKPLAGEPLLAWRQSVAYAPQEPFLFHDTIRANLLWAGPDCSEEDLWEALRLAAADGFVAALPKGLDTVTGDRGGRLSGGERQRLALARALLRKPAMLVLDEATSQLDVYTERRLGESLRSLRGRTTIVAVAHRTALMEAADRIIALDAGCLTAVGTWEELKGQLVPTARAQQAQQRRRPAASEAR